MKFLVLTILLSACTEDKKDDAWQVAMCGVDDTTCEFSTVVFRGEERCKDFASKADSAQPKVHRICVPVEGLLR